MYTRASWACPGGDALCRRHPGGAASGAAGSGNAAGIRDRLTGCGGSGMSHSQAKESPGPDRMITRAELAPLLGNVFSETIRR